MSKFSISLLGTPEFELNGEPLKPSIRKNTALLAYLAVSGESHSREALTALFWPDHDPSYARAGLRRNLSTLKKSLGGKFVIIERDTVSMDPQADIELDISNFRNQASVWETHNHPDGGTCQECIEAMEEAIRLYRGDFMEGFGLPDAPVFDEWQFFQAEGLRLELALVLEKLVYRFQSQRNFHQAIEYARRWQQLDTLNEPVNRTLMQLYASANQRTAALRMFIEFKQQLKEELGVEPEPETIELYQEIKNLRTPSPSTMPPEPIPPAGNDLLDGRYRLQDELGRGGLGAVYHAHDILLDRQVAVKVVELSNISVEDGIRLLEEAQAAAKLNHPNIIAVYDAGEAAGTSFIVMEIGSGASLHDEKPDSLERICAIARQICRALEYAHQQGIVHRDLKPENVILTEGGTVKLTDFGLARPVASRVTSTGKIAGTVYYIAPEVALGQKFDGRADLYALGVMLYELTTGRLPFSAEDPLVVITQHIHAPLVPPRARKANIPPALDALIQRLLSKNPDQRPESAAEVIRVLDSPDLLDLDSQPGEELSVLKRIERGSLVGREEELEQARSLWAMTLTGQGKMLMLSGEPGIGKTRLVREISTQVQVSGGQVFSGACYAEGGVPYAPFTQILRSALETYPLENIQLPESITADLSTLLPGLQRRLTDIESSRKLDDPTAEQHRLFESLVFVMLTISEKNPLLLVVEDIHWADSGTLHMLRHFARHTREHRLMLLTTFRDVIPVEAEVFHEMLLDLRREGLATHLKLSRLDHSQTEEMLRILFAEEMATESLDAIYDETEGNPFYIEEVCKALVESGKLFYLDGRWHRPAIEELGIPQSIRTVIQARIRVLPDATQKAIKTAAVIGREFDFDTLLQACGLDEDTLSEALDYCENAQLIEKANRNGKENYAFVHSLIPTTLVESMPVSKRRELYMSAGTAVEINHPDDYEALAVHFQRAGEEKKAAEYLLKAGDRARALYANQEAINSYQQALELLKKAGDLELAARTLMKMGLTYHNAFDFKASRQAFQEGFIFWQMMGEQKQAAPGYPPTAPHPLRVNLVEPATLGLGLAMDFPSHVMLDQLFSGLVEVSPDLGVLPDIAHSWEVLDGGRRYIFHLRGDVFWSDGEQVTAHDFEYTWKRTLHPRGEQRWFPYLLDIKNAAPYHSGEIKDIQLVGVDALDELTLEVEIEGPTSYFPYLMAFVAGFPMPRHLIDVYGDDWILLENMVTNGAFRVESWDRGQSLVLVRNPKYHGRFPGNIERVECSFIGGQPAKSLEMYAQDRLDICKDLPLPTLVSARQRYAGEYVSGPWMSTSFIGFDTRRLPFNDPRVRRAFALATDCESLADVILRGFVFPALGGFVPHNMPGHSPDIGVKFDPDQARQLLSEAGYAGGLQFPSLVCLARDDTGHDLACEYLRSQWQEHLGIKIDWKLIKWVDFYDSISKDTPNMWMVSWYADYPDPDNVLRISWWLDFTGWQNEAFNNLVEGARRVIDQEERMHMYRQADKILVEEAAFLPLCYRRFHMLVKPWVKNFSTSPLKWWLWKDIVIEPH